MLGSEKVQVAGLGSMIVYVINPIVIGNSFHMEHHSVHIYVCKQPPRCKVSGSYTRGYRILKQTINGHWRVYCVDSKEMLIPGHTL